NKGRESIEMETNYTLGDEAWRLLIEGVAAQFDELTIIRGFQYYKQGRVEALTLRDGVYLDARVTDSRDCAVTVDLYELGKSRCTCPLDRGCQHMVAALLRYAELCGRPIQAIVNARNAARGGGRPAATDAGRKSAETSGSVAVTRPGAVGTGKDALPWAD